MKLPFSVSVEPRTRFPLVQVPGTNYKLSWFPMTRMQIEYFLCDTQDSRFDRDWYLKCLQNMPHLTLEQLTVDTVRQVFLGNLTFNDARALSQNWVSSGSFDLPLLDEWRTALQSFDAIDADEAFVKEVAALPDLHPRARSLLLRVESLLQDEQRILNAGNREVRPIIRPFSHQLLLRCGIREYVYQNESRNSCLACGSGPHHRSLERGGNFETQLTTRLRDAGSLRNPELGFRLIVRAKKQVAQEAP